MGSKGDCNVATPVGDAVGLTGDARIDGLVQGSRWISGGGTTVITYSLSVNDNPQGGPWIEPLRGMVLAALSEWSKVANISFVEVDSGSVYSDSTADIAITLVGNELEVPGAVILGFTIFPDPAFADMLIELGETTRDEYPRLEGDVAFGNSHPVFQDTTPGGAAFWIAMHEIGHALGLKHPSDDGFNDRPTFTELGISQQDGYLYTVMTTSGNASPERMNVAATVMPLDILAIQRIYGANMTYRAGDDVYDVGVPLNRLNPTYTIWDGGGVDTIRAHITSINLRPGSLMMDAVGGPKIGIAYGTIIENVEIVESVSHGVQVDGNDASNTISGIRPQDVALGGPGDDRYFLTGQASGRTGFVSERENEGNDTVFSPVNYTLNWHVENLILTGTQGRRGVGSIFANTITGTPGPDILEGNAGNDTLIGGDAADTLSGGGGDDLLRADAVGPDTLTGGPDNDIYEIYGPGNRIVEMPDEGRDTLRSYAEHAQLPPNVEDLELVDAAIAVSGFGNALANVVTGNAGENRLRGLAGNDILYGKSGADTLDGGVGADALAGGAGDDAYFVDNTGDSVAENANEGIDWVLASVAFSLPQDVDNLELRGTASAGAGNAAANVIIGNGGSDTLGGDAGDDALYGQAGDDFLSGGSGSDQLDGGADIDTALYDQASSDLVVDLDIATAQPVLGGQGEDLLISIENVVGSVGSDALLGNNLANRLTGGAGPDRLIGRDGADTLIGGAGIDTLDGGAGADILGGGAGDDAYFVDNAGDVVAENANEGVDWVFAALTFSLPQEVEHLELLGMDDSGGIGNAVANMMIGNGGNNSLGGDSGDDTLSGGAGNDTLAGGAGADRLLGGDGNDTLNGGAGIDSLRGGAGDDFYRADDAGDIVAEGPDAAGIDTVQSAFNYSLGGAIENLVLTGSAVNGTGNANANRLSGNALANLLLGLTGNDTLLGGGGNDTLSGAGGLDNLQGGGGDDLYILDLATDLVTEIPNAGIDTVQIGVSSALPGSVENLTFTGAGAINGNGNAGANEITGNSGNNRLTGNLGNDTLNGGAGIDTLIGGGGNDRFVFTAGQANGDRVSDFAGNGPDAGDSLLFQGYGGGATFVQINPTTWEIRSAGPTETLTFVNSAPIDVTDYTFA